MPAHLLPGDEQAPDGVTVLAREYEEQVRYWRQARER
jgi:hypothetical protein